MKRHMRVKGGCISTACQRSSQHNLEGTEIQTEPSVKELTKLQ